MIKAFPYLLIIISWFSYIVYWLVSAIGVKKDKSEKGLRSWWWSRPVFVIRLFIALIIIASVIYFRGKIWIFNRNGIIYQLQMVSTSFIPAYMGAIICFLGIVLAIWARRYLGKNWSPHPALKEGHELVTSGPYSLLRHPIYTGILTSILGSVITTGNLFWLIIFIIVAFNFINRTRIEEGLMKQQFPDQYPEYKKRTWALIPYIY